MKQEKFMIKQFNNKYPDDEACLHDVFLNRYKNVKKCPECGNSFSFHKVAGRKCYACANCGHQLHPLATTIFHKSSTPLKSWFYAIFLFSISTNGVSGKELERQLGVTYKCAYRMGQQIRKLFDENVKPP
jgi:transposase-like protein